MNSKGYKIRIAITFIWVGFVLAISFMESWLKFQATGITTELGLSVGKLVFYALNKVELVCLTVIFLSILFYRNHLKKSSIALSITAIILLIQTFSLLPELDQRASLIIQEKPVLESNLHLYYVILEVIKVILLMIYGTLQLKHLKYEN